MLTKAREDILDVAKEFATYPAGRTERDGANNGTRFRDQFLVPRLEDAMRHDRVLVVDFNGLRAFPSSFLEEAIGGLVRHSRTVKHWSKDDIRDHLELKLDAPGTDRYQGALMRHFETELSRD